MTECAQRLQNMGNRLHSHGGSESPWMAAIGITPLLSTATAAMDASRDFIAFS